MSAANLLSRIFFKLHVLFAPKPSELFIPSENDVYLVSYPRSGNTWMRVLLSELLYNESGDSLEDLQYYVPDIYRKTCASDTVHSDFHVVKSHERYYRAPMEMSNYRRVIYLVRDPRDVVLSDYKYHEKLRGYTYRFDQFFLDWLNGRVWPCSWQEHVNSWTGVGAQSLGIDLHIIRYEDLLSNPTGQLAKVAEFLGLDVTKDAVQRAVDSASLERMRIKEKRGVPEHERAEGFQFVGKATSHQWLERLTPTQIDLITRYAGHVMKRLGYI